VGSNVNNLLEQETSKREGSTDELLDSPYVSDNVEAYDCYTQQPLKLLPFSTVPDMWRSLALCDDTAHLVAIEDPHQKPPSSYTYAQLESHMADFSRGLASKGVLPSQRVALFAEASSRWVIADGGILMSGAANAVRGSKAPVEELAYIAAHANVTAMVVDSAAVFAAVSKRMTPEARANLCVVVVLWGDTADTAAPEPFHCPVLSFEQVLEQGAMLRPVSQDAAGDTIAAATAANTCPAHPVQPGDLASVVYTSGTTGTPKGVMLTHHNLIGQVQRLGAVTKPKPGGRTLSLLPPWHAYERATAYFVYSCGVTQRYTNVASLKADLSVVRSVPNHAPLNLQPRNPQPATPNPKPQTPNLKLQTPNPKPQTPNPKPQSPKPQTHKPRSPKSQTPNIEAPNPKK
jgi:long-subunit acyl-CoA synthetase (AMP-forming)